MLQQSDNHVPDDLMQQLHLATEHVARSREEMEKAMNSSEFRHQDRIDTATAEFRKAEKEAEMIDRKITEFLYAGEGHA